MLRPRQPRTARVTSRRQPWPFMRGTEGCDPLAGFVLVLASNSRLIAGTKPAARIEFAGCARRSPRLAEPTSTGSTTPRPVTAAHLPAKRLQRHNNRLSRDPGACRDPRPARGDRAGQLLLLLLPARGARTRLPATADLGARSGLAASSAPRATRSAAPFRAERVPHPPAGRDLLGDETGSLRDVINCGDFPAERCSFASERHHAAGHRPARAGAHEPDRDRHCRVRRRQAGGVRVESGGPGCLMGRWVTMRVTDTSMKQTRTFERAPESVAMARRFVIEVLRGSAAETLETVALLASELASNCVLHTDGRFDVSIVLTVGEVRVEVTDRGGGEPCLRSPEPTDPTGRGLFIVDKLAAAWGVERRDESGKTVWFTIAADAPRLASQRAFLSSQPAS